MRGSDLPVAYFSFRPKSRILPCVIETCHVSFLFFFEISGSMQNKRDLGWISDSPLFNIPLARDFPPG